MKLLTALFIILLSAMTFSCNNTNEPAGDPPGIYFTVTDATGKEPLKDTWIYAYNFTKEDSTDESEPYIAPNPFSYAAGVCFSIQKDSKVKITVSETNGKLIETLANDIYPAGEHIIPFTADTTGKWKNRIEGFYIMSFVIDGKTQSILIYYNRDNNREVSMKGIASAVMTDSTGKAFISWDNFPFAASGLRFPMTYSNGDLLYSYLISDKIQISTVKMGYSAAPQEVIYQKGKVVELKISMIKF
jgi:hypothetical protein